MPCLTRTIPAAARRRWRPCTTRTPDATLLEVNTGAISRGYRDTPYPAVFLLREWRGMGGQIILTADAHSPETVVYGYGQRRSWPRAAGFRECVLLTGRGWKPCPL